MRLMVGKFYHLINQQEDYFKNIVYNYSLSTIVKIIKQ